MSDKPPFELDIPDPQRYGLYLVKLTYEGQPVVDLEEIGIEATEEHLRSMGFVKAPTLNRRPAGMA